MISLEMQREVNRMSKEDVSKMYDILKMRMKSLRIRKSTEFHVGQHVKFPARGCIWRGIVEKINQVSLIVKTSSGKWQVSTTSCQAE